MIKSRHILMAAVLGFMFLVFGPPKAHADVWAGDTWAYSSIELEELIISCEDLLKLSVEDFNKNKECDGLHLIKEIESISNELFAAMDKHPSNTRTIDFIKEHFVDVELGVRGLNALLNSIERIKILQIYLILYQQNQDANVGNTLKM